MNSTPWYITYISLISALFGGLLSATAGFFAVVFRVRVDRKQEIAYIKTGITDELNGISTIIVSLCETFRTVHMISNTYLNELRANRESYDYHKPRLFLITDETLRRRISAFYKSLSGAIDESMNTVGTLGENQKGGEHDRIAAKFEAIAIESKNLELAIKKYKYKAFWVV